jgi:metal-responsive CopG/Arc/MetJ family transcriptional regulator
MGKTVKTTITVDAKLWTQFGVIVLRKHGGRKKTDIVEQLIREYVEKNEGSGDS